MDGEIWESALKMSEWNYNEDPEWDEGHSYVCRKTVSTTVSAEADAQHGSHEPSVGPFNVNSLLTVGC